MNDFSQGQHDLHVTILEMDQTVIWKP